MIIGCDAKQLEWRTILELSRDETGIKEVLNGDDTHELNRVAFALPSRLIAKIYLFRTIFRGSGWSFANDPDFNHVSADPSFWDGINEKFFGKYYGITNIHNEWKDLVIAGKPIVGPLGREWQIPLARDRRGDIKIPWTTLSNYPVQGTGADVMMLARVSFWNRIRKYKIPVKMIQTVHDSIVVDGEHKYTQLTVDLFHEVFDDLQANIKRLFKYEWVVPLACECKAGLNMADMKEVLRST